MKLHTILFSLYALPLIAHGKTLEEALKDCGFNYFRDELMSDPMTYQRFISRNDVEIWAPVDSAYPPGFSANKKTLAARQSSNKQTAYQASHKPQPPPLKKRQTSGDSPGGEPVSNKETLITFLEDSDSVNLGPAQPARCVQDAASSAPGALTAMTRVKSGGGAVANVVGVTCKYDLGIIHGVDRRFSLPSDADETLTSSGLGSFLDAVEAAGLKEYINTQPSITLLVPLNSKEYNVREHIIQGPLGFVPEFLAKKTLQTIAGTTVRITQQGGGYYINGVRIENTDMITKNGVIHTLEKPLTGTTASSEDSPTSSTNADVGTKSSGTQSSGTQSSDKKAYGTKKAHKSSRPKRRRSIVNY